MCSFYDQHQEEEKREQLPKKGVVPSKEDCSYKYADGRVETVDLTKSGVYGLCCPEIVDLKGMEVLKGCKLQPIYEDSKYGKRVGYVSCGPLIYINNWERCLRRRDVE
jgi:hypothetical protein